MRYDIVITNPTIQLTKGPGNQRSIIHSLLQQISDQHKTKTGRPSWLSAQDSACLAGDVGSIPRLGRCPGGGNSNMLQYSCLENPMDRGA